MPGKLGAGSPDGVRKRRRLGVWRERDHWCVARVVVRAMSRLASQTSVRDERSPASRELRTRLDEVRSLLWGSKIEGELPFRPWERDWWSEVSPVEALQPAAASAR